MKVLFLGTPQIAASALQSLLQLKQEIMVITRPDKPSGRKMKIDFSAVKKLALANNLPVLQPEKIGTALEQIKAFAPDITICCAYGQLIPQDVLDVPRFGSVNIHASILPKYRGGAPLHWAVMNGEKKTGITYMYMVKQMDAGPTIMTRELSIGPEETTGELYDRMCVLIRESLLKDFFAIAKPNVVRFEQDHSQASLAPLIKREDEKLNFNQPVQKVFDKIRGLSPNPGAYFEYGGMDIKVLKAKKGENKSEQPGKIVAVDQQGVEISCTDGTIKLLVVQIPGKKPQELATSPHSAALFEVEDQIS